MSVRRRARRTFALGLLLAACGGKPALAPVGLDAADRAARRAAVAPPPVSGHVLTSIGERSIGPYYARRGTGAAAAGLVAWITVPEGWGRRVLVAPVGPDGAPQGRAAVVTHVPVDTTTVLVRPTHGPSPGFVVAWTSLTERGESLWSITVDDEGHPRGKPVELARTTDDVVWVDVVPTTLGAVVVWAEETSDDDANLVAAPLEADGKVRGAPTRIARGIVGWNVVALPTGVGISLVSKTSSGGNAGRGAIGRGTRVGGALSFQRLDLDGHLAGAPVAITSNPVVSGDVEVIRDGERLVFAWTDRSKEEPSITIAALSEGDVVAPPRTLVNVRGGASLLELAKGGAGIGVMFEAPIRREADTRRVHVARVADDLAPTGRPLSLEVVGRSAPELAATSSGFAVLATTHDCPPDDASCATARSVTTLFRTDASAGLVQREVLDFKTDPATLGWSMGCDGDTCFALAASAGPAGAPARVRATVVRPRTNVAQAVPVAAPPRDGPHVVDVTALASGERISDLATARFGEAELVALLSAKVDAPRPGPQDRTSQLTLTTRVVEDDGTAAPPSVLSTRALHVGGVALAATDKPDDGGAVAWVAREGSEPAVHVARIDKRGRSTSDIQLTKTKGGASDVTITWAGDGWIVAWVDGRHGDGEVYAVKLSADLSHVGRGERLTTAPGDASDLVAIAHGDEVWLAWADPRESPREGLADIFVGAVHMRDAKRAWVEQRVLPTAAHSRTPRLVAAPDGVHLAWIEEAPMGSATPSASGYGAFVVRLDDHGKPVDKPARVPLAGEGAATAVALDARQGVRAVVARSLPEGLTLDAVDLSASSARPNALLTLDGPPSLDVMLALEGHVLWFNDDGPHVEDRRVRRARIAWTP